MDTVIKNDRSLYLFRFITKNDKHCSALLLGPVEVGAEILANEIWWRAIEFFGNTPPPDNLRDIKIFITPLVGNAKQEDLVSCIEKAYVKIHIIYQRCMREKGSCVNGCKDCKYLMHNN